jgi:UDP-arabinose 4-epimerase
MAKVLVTGGAGYIGSHACKALAQAGHLPVVFDNLSFGHRDAVKWGPFEHGDLLDSHRLDAVFSTHRPDYVMHFAAFAFVGESVSNPAKYYRNNVLGSLNLLDCMVQHKVENLIFSSTCATYGTPNAVPLIETHAQKPINPYGQTKLIVEHALSDYASAYGLRFVAMRYFNAAGCDPEGELGERHEPETHAIPLAIEAALKGKAFHVFGTDYDTPDGSALRDYIHVSDLADAHVKGLTYLKKGGKNDFFNLATGRSTSVFDIIKAVETATKRKIPVTLAPRRAGDPAVLYATGEKARQTLQWQPQFLEINHIVETAALWFLRNHI